MHRAHVLRAIAATFVPGGEAVRLAERMDETIAALPHREDRDALHRLLSLLESRTVNALVAGRPRAFTAMSPPEREQYLRGWATSRLSPRRKAFQALSASRPSPTTCPGIGAAVRTRPGRDSGTRARSGRRP